MAAPIESLNAFVMQETPDFGYIRALPADGRRGFPSSFLFVNFRNL